MTVFAKLTGRVPRSQVCLRLNCPSVFEDSGCGCPLSLGLSLERLRFVSVLPKWMDGTWEQRAAPGPAGAEESASVLLSASPTGANQLLLHSIAPGHSSPLGPVRLVWLWCSGSEIPEFKRLCCTTPKYFFFLMYGTEYIAICCWEYNHNSCSLTSPRSHPWIG